MSNFKQNTVEITGDEALTASIIDGSIEEIVDDLVKSIRENAFRKNTSLKMVCFVNADTFGSACFRDCTSLETVELPSANTLPNNMFYGCTSLKKVDALARFGINPSTFDGCSSLSALIVRHTSLVTLYGSDPLGDTPIASGTGYIYVPAALVDSYKAASNWSTYAAQIRAIEDYPGVCDMYTWDGVFANIDDGSYASVYKIGDTVPLDLGSEGVVNMQIAAFDMDDKADDSGKAPISWISKELLNAGHRMNPACVINEDGTYQEGTGAIGGWEKCEMRTYLNETIKPLIPEEVRSKIVAVSKTQTAHDTSGASFTQTTEDDVWIPDINELGASGSIYYDLFQNTNEKRAKTTMSDENYAWWLRSSYNTHNFRAVSGEGSLSSGNYSGDNVSGYSYGYTSVQNALYYALGFCTK